MPNIVWNKGYSNAEAERGKFVVIDPTTITGYPTGGRGRYAVIVTSINTTTSDGFTIPSYDTLIYGYTSNNLISSETYQISGNTIAQINKFWSDSNLISAVRVV